jgi:beta-glucosidase
MASRRIQRWRTLIGAVAAGACAISMTTVAAAGAATPSHPATGTPIYLDTHYSFAERAADLVSRMTLQEKVGQLSTSSAPAIPRLGVQQYTYWSEGQHGLNTIGADDNNGGAQGGVHATSFPTNFTTTMSWDKGLIYDETTAISDEARGELDKSLFGTGQNNIGPDASDYGSLTYWAPTVNLDRDPRWGRTDEAFGEDPYLVGQAAGAFVDGYEGNTPTGKSTTGYLKVAATAKHYALNNVEDNRTGISSNVDDTDLRDYYTAQFRSLIENAHVAGLMTSYNAINGTPAVANTYTVNELAHDTYGFDGYITSDCGAVGTTYDNPPSGHDWAPPGWTTDNKGTDATWTNTATGATVSGQAGGEAYALRAGTGLNCGGGENTLPNIQQAINAGILSEGVIDTALVRIFTVRMQTGEFDPAGKVPYTQLTKDQIQSPAHQALAEKVAANSLVLLKNNDVTGTAKPLLPVDAKTLNKVVVLGDLANKVTLGGYSGDPSLQVNAVQGITSEVQAANPGAQVVFDSAGTSTTATGPAVLSAQTQADIRGADLVVVFVGTDSSTAGESMDRADLNMPGNYDSLIDQTTALGNPKVALVVQSDGPVKIDDEQAKVPAVVFSGYNGESQGTALADVLTGKQNPSGHLDFTWYKDASQLPAMSDYGLTPAATGGLGRTYQYFTGTPTYPFGYGLSYGKFAYSPATVNAGSVSANGKVDVTFTVKNTGTTAGATVAQLYVGTPFTVPGVQLPKERLEGFQKTSVLAPGASQRITLPVNVADLSFWDAKASRQVVYDGTYTFGVGTDADHVVSTKSVRVRGSLTPKVQYVTVQPEAVVYNAGDTIDLTGKNKWIKDDTDPTQEQRDLGITADNVVEAVDSDESFVNLKKAVVSYRSSDDAVATVSRSGRVKAVGDGVATISATVDGVTGSAPIVVGHSLKLAAPPVVGAGASASATTTFTNGSASARRHVAVSLTVPAGWTATATTPSTFASVGGGKTVTTTWRVSAPADAQPASYPLAASVSFTGGTYSATATVPVPYASFESTFDNPAITDDTNTTPGNIDGEGASLSAQALAAVGFSPGQPVTHDGLTFTWPSAATGTPDNVVAGGQSFAFTGSGSTLGLLGLSAFGSTSGSGTIVYSDGTTQAFSVAFADWWSGSATAGGDIAATLPYLNNPGGQQNQTVHVYYASVPLQAGKTISYLALPDVSQGVTDGTPAMHLFAVATG